MKYLFTFLLVIITLNSYTQTNDTLEYYKEICYKREFQEDLKKPLIFKKDITIYLCGDLDTTITEELDKIVSELNSLISSVDITVVNKKEESNITIFLGGVDGFLKETFFYDKDQVRKRLENNWGMFWINHSMDNYISSCRVFIDTERTSTTDERKHLLREELTQSLGFPNDSFKYPNSIFYSKWVVDTTEYTNLDKEIIKIHYQN